MHCDTFTALIDEAKTQREPSAVTDDSLSIENSNFNPHYNGPSPRVKSKSIHDALSDIWRFIECPDLKGPVVTRGKVIAQLNEALAQAFRSEASHADSHA